jgi:hypothetical protein
MGVNGGITGGSIDYSVLFPRDECFIKKEIPLGEPEVNQIDLMGVVVEPNAEVARFDVAVDEASIVNKLYAGNHLVRQHQHSLKRKSLLSLAEEEVKGGTHQVHHEHILLAFIGGHLPSVEQ